MQLEEGGSFPARRLRARLSEAGQLKLEADGKNECTATGSVFVKFTGNEFDFGMKMKTSIEEGLRAAGSAHALSIESKLEVKQKRQGGIDMYLKDPITADKELTLQRIAHPVELPVVSNNTILFSVSPTTANKASVTLIFKNTNGPSRCEFQAEI
ncbi:hypothetical protein FOZ60_014039 [Perkinsus olseni]|uniref:Uncharacterized protein n=1 Tax=Perkinsus olseni TaxID=32597 RepID=A0A7J6N887_PEROL|nr:hypothetical protein FOZ60_014039 [Perkinsus olseni]